MMRKVSARFRDEEYQTIQVVKDFLFREGLLKNNSDAEFLRYCSRHLVNELNERVNEVLKQQESK